MQHKKVQAGRLLLLEVCGKGHVGQAGPKVIKWLGYWRAAVDWGQVVLSATPRALLVVH